MKQKLFTRNFTLLLLGQVASLFGNQILRLALSMYVLETTGSAAIFAGILSISAIPTILLSPFGGVLADRANRRNMMVALDAGTAAVVFTAALFLTGQNAVGAIGVLLAILAVLGAFETPTVQACLPTMLHGDWIVKGNAAVNQAASLSALVAPMLGGIAYAAFGLKPVLYASVVCFLLTALLEGFIRLPPVHLEPQPGICACIRQDIAESVRYLCREQPDILKMLLYVTLSRFFVMGVTVVGLPYIVRTGLGLDAKYYGAAESGLAVASIGAGIAAALLTGRLKTRRLSLVLAALGVFLLPAGLVFLLPAGTAARYRIVAASFCGMQAAAGIFSIFAVSLIQQNTPGRLLGKVMAYTSAVTLCAQPFGQILYGLLFDGFPEAIALVLLPTGAAACLIGLCSAPLFRRMEAATQR